MYKLTAAALQNQIGAPAFSSVSVFPFSPASPGSPESSVPPAAPESPVPASSPPTGASAAVPLPSPFGAGASADTEPGGLFSEADCAGAAFSDSVGVAVAVGDGVGVSVTLLFPPGITAPE